MPARAGPISGALLNSSRKPLASLLRILLCVMHSGNSGQFMQAAKTWYAAGVAHSSARSRERFQQSSTRDPSGTKERRAAAHCGIATFYQQAGIRLLGYIAV